MFCPIQTYLPCQTISSENFEKNWLNGEFEHKQAFRVFGAQSRIKTEWKKKYYLQELIVLIIQALMFSMTEIRCAGYSNTVVINNQQRQSITGNNEQYKLYHKCENSPNTSLSL
ncbi:hypothetical protein LOAG_05114 [Loa loa]|uniref:Uncharacterized protein n=1 Tax=Loa loa TaxID=7209 RepID=A0A1S0U2J1_LOALO|nr:hypothetical protein LOAG_05114 [Loa loa]EFO23367.1 hypothetical protein LOAG_05114 [Loa loa]